MIRSLGKGQGEQDKRIKISEGAGGQVTIENRMVMVSLIERMHEQNRI